MSKQARCSCGAYARKCKRCGLAPGQEQDPDLFDYRPTPERKERIGRHIAEPFARSRVDRFIDAHCA